MSRRCPGAVCNRYCNPGFPVIQQGKQHFLGLPLPFCIYLPIFTSSSHVPGLFFFFGRKYGHMDKAGCSHVPSVPSHVRNGRSEILGALERQCVSQSTPLGLFLASAQFLKLFSFLFVVEWEHILPPVWIHDVRLIFKLGF